MPSRSHYDSTSRKKEQGKNGYNLATKRAAAPPGLPGGAASEMAVLPLGGNAAPDVALGLVELQNLPGLEVEPPVIERQPLGDILVYGCR